MARIAEQRSWSLSEYGVGGDLEMMKMICEHLAQR
jgi:hypothetical protein